MRSRQVAVALFACGVVFGASRLFSHVMDTFYYPWDAPANGHPPLTATWVGAMKTGSGKPRSVVFTMRRVRTRRGGGGRCPQCGAIVGSATTCDELGQLREYRISGTAEDRHATRLHVSTFPVRKPPPDGLELSTVRGSWSGDSLHFEAEFHWRKGKSAISDTADPDTRGWVPLPLARGTESDFRAQCARIVGH
ncbi:MAG: hypothetical protein ABJD07_12420 [Gemmatimonadaceae bacterium]